MSEEEGYNTNHDTDSVSVTSSYTVSHHHTPKIAIPKSEQFRRRIHV
jgi:hypothetical protein